MLNTYRVCRATKASILQCLVAFWTVVSEFKKNMATWRCLGSISCNEMNCSMRANVASLAASSTVEGVRINVCSTVSIKGSVAGT